MIYSLQMQITGKKNTQSPLSKGKITFWETYFDILTYSAFAIFFAFDIVYQRLRVTKRWTLHTWENPLFAKNEPIITLLQR